MSLHLLTFNYTFDYMSTFPHFYTSTFPLFRISTVPRVRISTFPHNFVHKHRRRWRGFRRTRPLSALKSPKFARRRPTSTQIWPISAHLGRGSSKANPAAEIEFTSEIEVQQTKNPSCASNARKLEVTPASHKKLAASSQNTLSW